MASSSSQEKVNGTLVLVNIYLSKTDPPAMFGDVEHGKFVQTYVVHNDKQGLGTERTLWDRPSNTIGVAVAPCNMDPALQRKLPRSCGENVVMSTMWRWARA